MWNPGSGGDWVRRWSCHVCACGVADEPYGWELMKDHVKFVDESAGLSMRTEFFVHVARYVVYLGLSCLPTIVDVGA